MAYIQYLDNTIKGVFNKNASENEYLKYFLQKRKNIMESDDFRKLQEKRKKASEIAYKVNGIDYVISEEEVAKAATSLLRDLDSSKTISELYSTIQDCGKKLENVDEKCLFTLEADFLVNIMEDGLSKEAALNVYHGIFKTECGKKICKEMFGIC